ncbi:hypothetical protein BUALT_Bualt05G0130300 [Buddleja alternifolia]|uniref:CCHC-type domain-containing protein n=1 Tax=Buddleja alternifolia TaxID=168488 RepID=A0AAV6XKC8_9LAMI|nr:hypothetical protein BUALT_Bualt05G0130300 [Buddleja alternifolia]
MDEEILRLNRALNITAVEGEGLDVPDGIWKKEQFVEGFPVVGRILTHKNLKFNVVRESLMKIFNPLRGMSIRKLNDKRLLFIFNHIVDRDRILDRAPWNFDNNLIVLRVVHETDDPLSVDLDWSILCVHVTGLPMNKITKEIAELLGNRIGRFVGLNMGESGVLRGHILRMWVTLNVTKPLPRFTILRIPGGGDPIRVDFSYERLGNFCYLCGILGHVSNYCQLRYKEGFIDPGKDTPYKSDLRVSASANQGTAPWYNLLETHSAFATKTRSHYSINSRGPNIFAPQKAELGPNGNGGHISSSSEQSSSQAISRRSLPNLCPEEMGEGPFMVQETAPIRQGPRLEEVISDHQQPRQTKGLDPDVGNVGVSLNSLPHGKPSTSMLASNGRGKYVPPHARQSRIHELPGFCNPQNFSTPPSTPNRNVLTIINSPAEKLQNKLVMGKKLDALLGRRFKTSKFKATANMAVSRLAVLRNQRQARCSVARSDVVEFLNNSNRDRALLRIIQKLSTRMPSLENKMKVLKDIASENNIDLPIEVEETVSCTVLDSGLLAPSGVSNPGESKMIRIEYLEKDEQLSDPVNVGRKYRDAADAAQAAFESATYAAVAARAAVQLSRSDPPSPDFRPPKLTALIEPMKGKLQPNEEDPFEKIHPVQNYDSKTKNRDLRIENVKEGGMSCDEVGPIRLRDVVFHEIDGGEERSGITYNEDSDVDQKNDVVEGISRGDKHFPLRCEVGYKTESSSGNFDAEKRTQTRECLKINRRPVSVRTRWTHAR